MGSDSRRSTPARRFPHPLDPSLDFFFPKESLFVFGANLVGAEESPFDEPNLLGCAFDLLNFDFTKFSVSETGGKCNEERGPLGPPCQYSCRLNCRHQQHGKGHQCQAPQGVTPFIGNRLHASLNPTASMPESVFGSLDPKCSQLLAEECCFSSIHWIQPQHLHPEFVNLQQKCFRQRPLSS